MSRGKQPFIQQQMNRTWIGHGSWQSPGRQTGAQAGRRAGWLAGWQADEQACPSDANYCSYRASPSLTQHGDRKRHSGQRQGGAVAGCERWRGVRGGGGSCRREYEKGEGEEKEREARDQRGGGGVKLQLLMQERRRKTFLASFPPSVSAVDTDSAAPVKKV